MSRFLSLILIFFLAGAARAQAKPEPLALKVKNSIARGVANLVSKQNGDGGWEVARSDYDGGPTALAVLALLNCDGVLDDATLEKQRQQSIERGLQSLRGVESPRVYVRALQTMALAEAGLAKDRPILEKNVAWLLKARVYRAGKFIGWSYDQRELTISSDASNSQYAMLALWYARQAGVEIKREVWVGIRDYYVGMQKDNGAWIYSKEYGPTDIDKDLPSRTMSVAGLCGLLIASMELNGGREEWRPNGTFANCGVYAEDEPVARALKWINASFNVELSERTEYHLYGIERAGRLSGLRFFGDHDWYREGCELLTKRQAINGSWPTHAAWADRWPTTNTSFALLFLSKGRTPVLIGKLVHGKWIPPQGRNEQDTDWNNDRNDLRHLTEYISRGDLFKKKTIGWQTYDISQAIQARLDKKSAPSPEDEDAVVADMLQSPILYVTGHKSLLTNRVTDIEKRLIKRYVDNGGFLFAEACCGSKQFDQGVKEWVQEIFEGAKLEYLESSHPVWTCFHVVPAGQPYKLMALSVGCRTVMLYSPQDLSCFWESNRLQDAKTELAFKLGSNIVAYATGRVPPQPRLTPIEIVSEKATKMTPKRGYFQVGQIRYRSDDWQPAPKAMHNLMLKIHEVTGLDVKLETERVDLNDRYENGRSLFVYSKFLYIHGRHEIKRFPDADMKDLRFALSSGGLLLADACCGDKIFDKTFREFVKELFPDAKLERVPVDPQRDELFGKELNGVALSKDNIKCRIKSDGPLVSMEPYLEGVRIDGRWVLLYSPYDLGCALERQTSNYCVGYDPASAQRIATAIVRYHTRP